MESRRSFFTPLGSKHDQQPEPPEIKQLRQAVLRTTRKLDAAEGASPRILFFGMRNWMIHTFWESFIATGLRFRGADCVFYTCGGGLSLCGINTCHFENPTPCHDCYPYVKRILDLQHLPHFVMDDFVSRRERTEARQRIDALREDQFETFAYGGLPLGQLVQPSVRWYLRTGTIGNDLLTHRVYRNILADAVLMTDVCERLLSSVRPEMIFTVNGLFYAERILTELARKRGVDVIFYEQGLFLPDTLFLSRGQPACHYDISESWIEHRNAVLTPEEESELDEYLQERSRGGRGTSRFWPSMSTDREALGRVVDGSGTKKLVTLFTNVMGDTACQDKDRAFRGMVDWVLESVRYFLKHPEVQVVIRIHPSEVKPVQLRSTESVKKIIEETFPNLPPHIRIIPPESDLSSYLLMDRTDLGLVYSSTVGLEMILKGVPVLVAGRPHYSGKGFTREVRTREEYHQLLDEALKDPAAFRGPVEAARKYLHTLVFRHLIPFKAVQQVGSTLRLRITRLDQLAPGEDPGLDVICEGILGHQEFCMPRAREVATRHA